MSPATFFAASGVIAWLVVLWKTYKATGTLLRRLRWAVRGAKRPARYAR